MRRPSGPVRASRARATARAHALGDALALARALANTFALTRDLALDADLNRAIAHARDFAHDLAIDLAGDLALNFAGDITRDLSRDLTRIRNLADNLDLTHIRADASDIASDLALALHQVDRLVAALDAPEPGGRPMDGGVRPARSAAQLTNVVVRVVPTAHRGRYDEEFRNELHELAEASTSRWQQLLYAIRLLDRVWVLRAELRTPARRKAGS